ncbi:hypothetical protein [Sphingomonas sp. dw_22]|uniref:hypothetical protein n=1 Tax=Sphingomonas sp. dw_22 TaxID=2721175 RepID=UPI002116CC1B|nr:hypothetical protein [Sphingomonas sp. dw_22]
MTINRRVLIGGAGITLVAIVATTAGLAQSRDTPPEARYFVDAGTIAGMMGRGDQHELVLRLGSRLAPTGGEPKADHFMPEAARLGASVPLETPKIVKGEDYPTEFQRPKGRLLIYWGCGAHAGPGQPVVIDFARVAQGQFPPGLFSVRVPVEDGPRAATSRTYGDWPNSQKTKTISGKSSLIGQHRVVGNYSADIDFTLGQGQDFMDGLRAKSSANADGSIDLGWNALGTATGYYAWMFGTTQTDPNKGGDMVWWASSTTKEFGGGLWNWLSPATVSRLIGQKIVMPPSQTRCTVPAEVKQAGPGMLMGFIYAYGPEANFAFPERPRDPKVAWRPKWTAKVRYRSMGMVMPGMPSMGDMMMGRDERSEQPSGENEQPKKCKPKVGGMLGRAILGKKAC